MSMLGTAPLRILHCVEFYAPSVGGAQEVVRQLSERLAAAGHDVTVATTRLPQRTTHELNGVKIVEFDVSGNAVRGMSGDVEGYRRFVTEGGFDVVMAYATQQWATDALLPIAGQIGAATVLAPCGFSALHDPAYDAFFRDLPAQMAAWDRLVFHSSTYQDVAFARNAGLTNIAVIPNGADEQEFAVSPQEAAQRGRRFRDEHGIGDEPLLLTVGSHTGGKGHSLVLDALVRLRRPATLALVGNTVLGAGCLGRCRRRAKAVEVLSRGERRALLVDPPREGVVDAYFAADLFVFGSRVECSPLVLFEAAAAGLPFVTVPAGNSAEIARWTGAGTGIPARRKNGIVRGSSADMARQIQALLDDPQRRERMGHDGHAAWERDYSWQAIVARYEKLYEELSAGRSPRESAAASGR
jgi:glycosyltransferase involved in cell wall biosynthesis